MTDPSIVGSGSVAPMPEGNLQPPDSIDAVVQAEPQVKPGALDFLKPIGLAINEHLRLLNKRTAGVSPIQTTILTLGVGSSEKGLKYMLRGDVPCEYLIDVLENLYPGFKETTMPVVIGSSCGARDRVLDWPMIMTYLPEAKIPNAFFEDEAEPIDDIHFALLVAPLPYQKNLSLLFSYAKASSDDFRPASRCISRGVLAEKIGEIHYGFTHEFLTSQGELDTAAYMQTLTHIQTKLTGKQ